MSKCRETERVSSSAASYAMPLCPRCGKKMLKGEQDGKHTIFRHPEADRSPVVMGDAYWDKVWEENDGR